MPRKKASPPTEHPSGESLRELAKGLRTVKAVLSAAVHEEMDSQESRDQFQKKWKKVLLGEVPHHHAADSQIEDELEDCSILKTGVSIVARRGAFYSEFYVKGFSKQAVRRSTSIPLEDMKPPKNLKDNPLWWWESIRFLELLKHFETAIIEKFNVIASILIREEAGAAAMLAFPRIDECLRHVEEFTLNQQSALDLCVPFFEGAGIQIGQAALYLSGFSQYEGSSRATGIAKGSTLRTARRLREGKRVGQLEGFEPQPEGAANPSQKVRRKQN